jgi:radical SAM-linked protein
MRSTAAHPARLHYRKHGKVRFLGHRDVARNLERAFRIARLPLAFSEGFHPHPKISFGLALTTGFESDAEYLDVEFTEAFDLHALPAVLRAALPDGLDVVAAVWLDDGAPALQEAVSSVVWEVEVVGADDQPADPCALARAVADALAAPTIECTKVRKGRSHTDDIRPCIRRIVIVSPDSGRGPVLELELTSSGVKPAEVVSAIGPFAVARGRRTHQYIERDGVRHSPLHVDVRAPIAEAIAS